MNRYKQFVFENYNFDIETKTLTLDYSLDESLHFTEIFTFDFDYAQPLNPDLLDIACQTVFFIAGVSYYKTYLPPEIVVRKGQIDQQTADFLSKTYQKGLGEFFYVNNLDPHTPVIFPITTAGITVPEFAQLPDGKLVGIGGGKDSLLSIELLRDESNISTWSVGHKQQLMPLVERIGLEHYWVERSWDKNLLELNKLDAYNGHIPISAIFAAVGVLTAVLSGKRDVVVSNESSANESNLTYRGIAINHQYSKSLEFEQDFQTYLSHRLKGAVRYYSLLRPFSELKIAKFFAKTGLEKYRDVFSSCNRAFTHASDHIFWCGECPKCAFVFLALTPFVKRDQLEKLFGKNLSLDPKLEPTYRQLLGIEGDKPMECVGEIKESRAAMRMAQQQYPELMKYVFELPADYNYSSLSPHAMPAEIFKTLELIVIG